MRNPTKQYGAALSALSALCASLLSINVAAQQAEPSAVHEIEITASRVASEVELEPSMISVVSGTELRARGVHDLSGAVALAAGVEAPPGGDTGPAGAVPSFWGLHEFDAFLLVVDGVPWGGAFNPAIPTLNLNNVERIEIVRGAAPVMFGATSFVGVIQVIHYAAGSAANEAQLSVGSHGSVRASMAKALDPVGSIAQSIAVDSEDLEYRNDGQAIKNGHAAYRASGALGDGRFRFDADFTAEHQKPSSPVIRQGTMLTTLTPLDANYNPSDARIDENRSHITLGYAVPSVFGQMEATASFAYSDITDIRGFLRSDLNNDGSENADSQQQHRTIIDDYFDVHWALSLSPQVQLVYGADLLYGVGKQTSINGAYYAPLIPSGTLPSTASLHVDEINTVSDRRSFVGEYLQAGWKPDAFWNITGGLRLNQTSEHLVSQHVDGFDSSANLAGDQSRTNNKLAGTLGASYKAWQQGSDEAVLFATYRNAFKPAAIDFGPDYRPDVLKPETAQSWEAGLRGVLGQFDFEAGLFQLDFKNLVVTTTDDQGNPLVQNAGGERLRGAELESHYRVTHDLKLAASASYHDTRFTDYVAAEGGANVDASGKTLPMAPHTLVGVGVLYQPVQEWNAALTANYVGARYMDIANSAVTPAYTTLNLNVGYRWQRYHATLEVSNLTDRRPPVSASEFGDQSYYLLPSRAIFFSLGGSLERY